MTRNAEVDIRLTTTTRIWGMATAMLALCIPLSAVTKSGSILPLAVVVGAVIGTVTVWKNSDLSNNHLINIIQTLERRITDLETICTTQELDLQRKIKRLGTED